MHPPTTAPPPIMSAAIVASVARADVSPEFGSRIDCPVPRLEESTALRHPTHWCRVNTCRRSGTIGSKVHRSRSGRSIDGDSIFPGRNSFDDNINASQSSLDLPLNAVHFRVQKILHSF